MKVVTSDEMRAIERAADGEGEGDGLTFAEMMRRAGAATAREAAAIAPPESTILVICGPGNNGGDGLVAARILQAEGPDVRAIVWGRQPDDLLDSAKSSGVEILDFPQEGPITDALHAAARRWIDSAAVLIDALFGTGLSRPIDGVPAELLRLAGSGRAKRRVVAVDVPSGMNADSGAVDPLTLRADVTIAFGFPKVGHLFMPGAERTGRLVVDPIGIQGRYADSVKVEMITGDLVGAALPRRPVDGHKGTFGHAMIVAGSLRYTGAAGLAAEAAYRAGAGLVTLAIPRVIHAPIAARLPEAVFLPLPDDGESVSPDAAGIVREALIGVDAVLIGPGLTTNAGATAILDAALEAVGGGESDSLGESDTLGDSATLGEFSTPARSLRIGDRLSTPSAIKLVIDADSLSALAAEPAHLSRLPAGTVLTPHPGEMARLTIAAPAPGWSPKGPPTGIERLHAAKAHAASWGAIVVLKGANTVIASPNGQVAIVPFATSALATAGSGDVLAGIITGLLAGGAEPFEAAWCGAWLHGLCGMLVRDQVGERAAMAGDILARIGDALAAVERSNA